MNVKLLLIAGIIVAILAVAYWLQPETQQQHSPVKEQPVQEKAAVGMRLNIVEEDNLLVEVPDPKTLQGNFIIEWENMPANEIIYLNISERSAGIATNNDGKGEALICAEDIDDRNCILTFPKSENLDMHVIILNDDYNLTIPTADNKPMVFVDADSHPVPVKFLGSEWVVTKLEKNTVKKPSTPATTSTPECTWICGSWSACSSSGTQTRTCTSSPSPCTGTNPNPTSQACIPEPTCDTSALGSCLSGNCIAVYGPGGSANCPEKCKINDVYDDNCMANECNVPYQNCIAACHTSNPPCTLNEVYAVLATLSG